ncbi:uncharacterized protein LOC143376719 isoform X2 [Andrena cerasifolii]|uniref:uncharacterized protein LOC143376719 isoform X2 n=1 Tax=Andrena cerasifolii TaxID=2819439 RepID=UPI0040376462
MFKKKENSMTYFLGGTAVGMAAGLLVGKLISKSTTNIQSFEPGIPTRESGTVHKYSQDDNIHNPYFHKNIHCHTRSRSASRYETNSRSEQPVSATSLTKLNDFNGNINYYVPEEKCANVQKISCNNNQLLNMSMENNAGYNLSDEVFPDRKEEEEYNNSRISNTRNAGRKPSCVTQSNSPGSTNTEHKDPSKIINIESVNSSNVKDAKSCSSIEMPETSNDLSSDSHVDDSSVCSNIQNTNNSTTLSKILQSASYRVMCNSISQSNYEEEEWISRSSSSEEFYDADLISSTRENNLGVM